MKQLILIGLALIAVTACGNSIRKAKGTETETTQTVASAAANDVVNVYYFHGKQRCKTCIAVGDVTEKTIKDLFANNPKVRFVEVKTQESENAALVEKHEVTWNDLIIAKGDDHVEITKYAFANAINSPDVLEDLIKTEVDKRLE